MGIAYFFMLRNWSGAVDNLAEYQVQAALAPSLCLVCL